MRKGTISIVKRRFNKDVSTAAQVTIAAIPAEEDREGAGLSFTFKGRLDSTTTAVAWRRSLEALTHKPPGRLVVDASGIDYCDGSGIGLLFELRRRQLNADGRFELRGLKPQFQRQFDIFDPSDFKEFEEVRHDFSSTTEELGRAAYGIYKDIGTLIAFVGELTFKLTKVLFNPRQLRWREAFYVAETTGVNALPIVLLTSFLVGLIISFQAAIPMKIFGATIYVANLIGVAMFRELGPLMTAIVLAGRSGSAFAAELGTMKVNEEIDALTTMGLDPVKFIVVPRVIAAVFMTPLLTIFANLIGVIGGAVVMLSLGFTLTTYYNQVLSSVTFGDFLGGLAKSVVFGLLIAGIGCLRGLQTGKGASAVGESTTTAVVSGIVLIIVTDGIFSVLFFYLGI